MLIFHCGSRDDIIRYLNNFYLTLQENEVALSHTHSTAISVSGGFALADTNGDSITELLSHADEALYEVKKTTRGTYKEYVGSVIL